jgi:hypothetical protein
LKEVPPNTFTKYTTKFSIMFCKDPSSLVHPSVQILDSKTGKGRAIPLQAWTGPEGSRRLRLPDFNTIGT